MTRSAWVGWLKVYAAGAAIIGTGALLFKLTTPTDEQLINALSPELRAQYEKERQLRQSEQQQLMEVVKSTASSEDPIWKTGSIQSPWERKGSVQTRDQFQKLQADQLQKEELKRIKNELEDIRRSSREKTNEIVRGKSWWKFW